MPNAKLLVRLRRRLAVDAPAVLGTTGITLVIMGAAQLVPAFAALFLGGVPAWALFAGAALTLSVGAALVPLSRRGVRWTRRESLAVVALSWVAAVVAGAVPFVITGSTDVSGALLEAASGITTTGATVFPDVDAIPPPLHLWRAMTHWLGGAGIVLVALLVFAPWVDRERLRRTQRSEASFLTERYRGSTRATLRGLFSVYVSATLLLTLILWALEMTLWEAVLHAFATISTGGFSTRTASLGAYGPAVQVVTFLFMVLGALNFAVLGRVVEVRRALLRASVGQTPLRRAWTVGRGLFLGFFETLWRSGEVRGYLLMVAGVSVAIAAALWAWGSTSDPARYTGAGGAGTALLDATFTAGAISTTTGFVTEDYTRWPAVCQVLLLFLMLVGGCSGSTAGGIKFRRLVIIVKYLYREALRLPRPMSVMPIKLGGVVVPEEHVREAVGYLAVYGTLILLVAALVALSGADPVSAGGASVSAFGSIGPAWGWAYPYGSFEPYAPFAKVLLAFAMLLGRLEIYALLATVLPSFWLRRK